MRADRSTSRVGRIWLDLEPRRETLFLINIGVPILIGGARGEGRGALIGGITGLLLSLADLEGPLARRLRLTLMVAAGIAVGGLLGIWLKSFEAIFWIAFFLAVFAAGFLNQVGKGPHFSLRFGAISFAVVAGLPAIETLDYVYWGTRGDDQSCFEKRRSFHQRTSPTSPDPGSARIHSIDGVGFAFRWPTRWRQP